MELGAESGNRTHGTKRISWISRSCNGQILDAAGLESYGGWSTPWPLSCSMEVPGDGISAVRCGELSCDECWRYLEWSGTTGKGFCKVGAKRGDGAKREFSLSRTLVWC